MRIVVLGGTGLVGGKLVRMLAAAGHDPIVAARATGVDLMTGGGLGRALEGAEAVVDVSNAGYSDPAAMLRFVEAASEKLFAAELAAGIAHHISFSVVGAERIDTGYFRAKNMQEALVEASGVPYTIVRSTPLLDYIDAQLAAGREASEVRVPPIRVQPIAADDAARVLADVSQRSPANGILEVAGPNIYALPDLARQILTATDDYRPIRVDETATFFGAGLHDVALVATAGTHTEDTGVEDWIRRALVQA